MTAPMPSPVRAPMPKLRGLAITGLGVVVGLAACRPRSDAPAVEVDAGAVDLPALTGGRISYPATHGSFVDLVADAAGKVVSIRATTPVRNGPAAMFPGAPEAAAEVGLGTGFLIEHRGMFVLTNDHIAAAAGELRVVLADGSEAVAAVVGRDPRLDVALLSIDVPRLRAMELAATSDLEVGEWVVALGNPFGEEITASAGIVSSTGRAAAGSVVGGPSSLYRTFIQTDARIHRGNTGGPLINAEGKVVGLNVALGDRPGELSFAVPIERIREVLDALRDYGTVARAYLGAMVNQVTPELAQRLGLAEVGGAVVTEVHTGSPAIRAGIRPGDVVLEWNGKKVDHRTLPSTISTATVGKKVNVVLWRSGAAITLGVTPDKAPN